MFTGHVPKVYFNGGLYKLGFVCYSADGTLKHAYSAFNPVELLTNNTAEIQALLASIRYLASEAGVTYLAT